MTNTITIRPDAATGRQTGMQAARMIRNAVRQATQTREPRPPVPWQHHVLFREPAYTDGQPYATGDLEDDGGAD